MERCCKKVMIQLMVGNYLRYTDRSLIPSNRRFLLGHLVNPLCLRSAWKSESCRWPLCIGIRLGACLSYVILPFHSDLAISYDDSTLVFREYISKVRSPSQQHLAIPCDDSMFAFHCVFTSIPPLSIDSSASPPALPAPWAP